MNALAGGGTLLTFPTLVFLGMPAIQANATSTVALLPGAASSLAGYRREVATHRAVAQDAPRPEPRRRRARLGPPPDDAGEDLRAPRPVPRPLRDAPLPLPDRLFAAGGTSRPRADEPDVARWAFATLALQFGVAIYGGYFGAGIGILMLVILGFLGLDRHPRDERAEELLRDLHQRVAAGYFILRGAVVWPVALVMVVGATLGGYAGAHFARRIGKEKARVAVVVIGFGITILLFLQRA